MDTAENTNQELYFGTSFSESTLTPAILAGLNERSQSAYAAPAPKPVDSAMGHVRPNRP